MIGRPSRITYVRSTNSLIVTDDQARRMKVFSAADWTQQGSVFPSTAASGSAGRPLQYPSGHCMTPDGERLAVIDFESKSVVVWNTDSADKKCFGTNSDPAMVCQTGLPCPGNVAITSGGQLAVTDSKVRSRLCFKAVYYRAKSINCLTTIRLTIRNHTTKSCMHTCDKSVTVYLVGYVIN